LKYLIVALFWVGYGAIHSLLISSQFSKWVAKVMGKYFAFYRLAYNLLSLILLIVLLNYSKSLGTELVIKFLPPWIILQQVLLIGSGVVIVWAFLSYDFLEFMGIRQILEFREKKDFTHPKTITKRGLLGIVRHPMYLATIVFIWSLNSTWVDIVVHFVLTLYILIGIRLEERKLVRQLGSVYIEYQNDVPALIPFTKK
jgi:protein-S-isoprenylcysteine O-methyltransferase Ste14